MVHPYKHNITMLPVKKETKLFLYKHKSYGETWNNLILGMAKEILGEDAVLKFFSALHDTPTTKRKIPETKEEKEMESDEEEYVYRPIDITSEK